MAEYDDPVIARWGFILPMKAAARGDVIAQLNLGYAFANGHGTAVDYAAATKWNERAALAGNRTEARHMGPSCPKCGLLGSLIWTLR